MSIKDNDRNFLNILFFIFMLVFVFGFMIGKANAHGGGVNSNGCHNQRSTSSFHCHNSVITKDNIMEYFDYTEYEVLSVSRVFGVMHRVHSKEQFCYVYYTPLPVTPNSSASFLLDSVGICREKVQPFTFQDLLDRGDRRLPPPSTTPRLQGGDIFKLLRERAEANRETEL